MTMAMSTWRPLDTAERKTRSLLCRIEECRIFPRAGFLGKILKQWKTAKSESKENPIW